MYSEDQVIVSEWVQKQAAIFATRTNELFREILVQLRKISRMRALFIGYIGEEHGWLLETGYKDYAILPKQGRS
jgi:hypothetical protein